jgi:hypothetical protein
VHVSEHDLSGGEMILLCSDGAVYRHPVHPPGALGD